MKNFVSATWVFSHLYDSNVVIIDCRYNIISPKFGYTEYLKSHIPGAIFFDINTDISGKVERHGGVRPLPKTDNFKKRLESSGISNDTTVIIYDQFLNGVSRLWWMLKYFDHKECYIMNGGISEWKNKGYPLSQDVPNDLKQTEYFPNIKNNLYCDIEYVKERKNLNNVALIDAREYERYAGIYEPFYAKAGHIPGALCIPWSSCTHKASIKKKEDLKAIFADILHYEEVIFYCGSGIAACGCSLALDELDKTSKVYIGSLTDWISYEENEVAIID